MKLLIPIVILLVILLGICWIFFRFTFTRSGFPMPGKPHLKEDEVDLRPWKNHREVHDADVSFLRSLPAEEVHIISDDGLKLYGNYIRCEHPKRIVLCVHGYRGQAVHDFASAGRWLHEENCDLLLITQRASGRSEGEYITFGAKEKLDVRAWAQYLEQNNTEHLPIYLYGISMGCTTVLLSAGLSLPDSVKGIIADCGFSSIRGILSAQAKQAFHLPSFPAVDILELYCILLAKFSYRDGEVKEAMRNNRIPVLFIHGGDDHFVRPENSRENYNACAAPKQLVIVEHGIHASSFNENETLYRQWVRKLFAGTIGQKEEKP